MRRLLALLASIVMLPIRMIDGTIRYVMRMISPPPAAGCDEHAAATQAAQQTEAQQVRADAAQDAREMAQHLRRVISARARGQVPDQDHVSRLPAPLAAYVAALSIDECVKLQAMPTARLRDLISGKPVVGIRTPDQLAAAPADELAARRAARREQVKAALRARSIEDVLADVSSNAV